MATKPIATPATTPSPIPSTTTPSLPVTSVPKILEYARKVASNPTAHGTDCPERSDLFKLRDGLYCGSDQPLAERQRKRTKLTEAMYEGKPCSPSLFSFRPTNLPAKSSLPSVISLESTFRPPGATESDVSFKLESILSTMSREYKLDARSKNPDENATNGLVGAHRHTTLGAVMLPTRRPHPLDVWTPHQIAVFESGLCLYGKRFDVIANLIPGKSTQDVVEFYYHFKKTSHYAVWKRTFKPVDPAIQ